MPPPSRCARVADLAESSATTRSASPTSRTWSCRTSQAATCPRSGTLLEEAGLATANINLITDIIACPGMDYCALANARSIPIAQAIASVRRRSTGSAKIGELKIKISGCINACGHHHVGHIGILGLDKKGEEFYQITLGGERRQPGRDRQDPRPGLLGRAGAGRDRADRRGLSRAARRRRRAVPRRLSPRRRAAVQGEALCRCLRPAGSSPTIGVPLADDEAVPGERQHHRARWPGSWPKAEHSRHSAGALGVRVEPGQRVEQTRALAAAPGAGGAELPELRRRPRLQHRPHPARALRLRGRGPRGRRRADRPLPVHAPVRLRRLRDPSRAEPHRTGRGPRSR